MGAKTYAELRSARWFATQTRMGHIHRQRTKQAGFTQRDFEGKPVITILSTWSELNPCHIHLRERADDVRRGILQAGGFPVEIPVMSLGEPFMKPSTMLYRNLLAIEVEETLRCHPIDGAVLMGGCDKTTPAMLMGAISMDLPCIFVPAGPMLTGRWRGRTLGSGTDASRAFMELRAGTLSHAEFAEMEEAGARSPGTCMTMGTASTMTSLAEVLGFSLPGASSIPAPDSRHRHMASLSGRRAVEMVHEDLKPSRFLSRNAFLNAVHLLMALGGSTNAIVHLLALARRAGVALDLGDFDKASDRVPVLADLKPSGAYLMEDFFEAGGLRALLAEIADLLSLNETGVTGRSLGEAIAGHQSIAPEVIRPRGNPLQPTGGIRILKGNIAPNGCVLKTSAASPELLRHRGRVLAFDSYKEYLSAIDGDDLDVDAGSILVVKNIGPRGAPGMPEWGMLHIPRKLLEAGVRDMLRVSDARMSGTAFGTVILHVAPEAAAGGPFAAVRTGDMLDIDADGRRIHLDIPPADLALRMEEWRPPAPRITRGWGALYTRTVGQADEGCDLDFLVSGDPTPEPDIYG